MAEKECKNCNKDKKNTASKIFDKINILKKNKEDDEKDKNKCCDEFKPASSNRPKTQCVAVPARIVNGVNIPAANLYVKTQGKYNKDKPTILFIHGTSASNIYWACVQELLSRDYYTVSLDLRGHGQSQQTPAGPLDPPLPPIPANLPFPLPPAPVPPAGQVNYTHELFADDINAVLNHLKITKNIIWAGVSIGGSIGLFFVAKYPGVVARLAMFSAGPGLYRVPICPNGTLCLSNPACSPCWPYFIPVNGTPDTLLPEAQFCPDQLVDAKAKIAQNQARAAPIIPNLLRYAWTENLRPILSQIKIPTLIGYGSIDLLQPDGGSSKYMHDNIDGSVLVEFAGKGHLMMITDYTMVSRVLKDFIEKCALPEKTVVFNTGCCVCPLVKPESPFTPCPSI